jgi:glyoxylase-like metal-dependent hydrolase (beta-lactamase superfamily II)
MNDYKLDVVDLDQKREGYRQFLSCWVYQSDELVFIVDPGPKSTIGILIENLRKLGIQKIDFILLTHIHLDHGGGTKEVVNAFPGVRVYCHEKGVKHIVDPSKLWRGSQKVLGEVADMYGEPGPVPAKVMADASELEQKGIEVIPTPGHAVHHVSFVCDDILFAGEAFGTRAPLSSGRRYLRPATPPKFFFQEALGALDKLSQLKPEPSKVAFAHYGLSEGAFEWCRIAKEQLNLWVDTIRDLLREGEDDLEQRLFEALMKRDPYYGQGLFEELPPDIRNREREFLQNTLDGMLGDIRDSASR